MSLVENVLSVYRAATDEQIVAGTEWYPNALQYAIWLDPFHPFRAAGIIAALSPKNGWDNNKAKATLLYSQKGDGTGCGMRGKHGNGPVDKAERIYHGEDPLDVLGGNKTRNFFCTIMDPLHDIAVIDAHSHDAAIGRPTSDKERSILQRKGEYDRYAQAYGDAAAREGLPVSVIQAVTWVSWRDRLGKGWYG